MDKLKEEDNSHPIHSPYVLKPEDLAYDASGAVKHNRSNDWEASGSFSSDHEERREAHKKALAEYMTQDHKSGFIGVRYGLVNDEMVCYLRELFPVEKDGVVTAYLPKGRGGEDAGD